MPSTPEPEKEHELEAARTMAQKNLDKLIEEQKTLVAEQLAEGRILRPEQFRADKELHEKAENAMNQFILAKEFPIRSVSREKAGIFLDRGMPVEKTAYQRNVELNAATLGRDPFLPEGEDRVLLEVQVKSNEAQPRFTGKENIFQGIVGITKYIPPERIRVVSEQELQKRPRP